MQPYLALITPISGGQPDQGLPGLPPIASQGPGFPTNPIAPGGRPPIASTGPGFPTNPIAPGGPIGSVPPPTVWVPVFPTNPIAPGGGGERPDQSLPGDQPGVMNPIAGAFILVWSPQYGWILVAQGGGISQGPGGQVDNTLPGAQPGIDNKPIQPKPEPKK